MPCFPAFVCAGQAGRDEGGEGTEQFLSSLACSVADNACFLSCCFTLQGKLAEMKVKKALGCFDVVSHTMHVLLHV
jgi:hypothetical protein